jgi:M6 family metalloprotease-like protein
VELPDAAVRLMERDPTAFTFKRALIHKAARLRENRRLLEQGLLDTRGKTPEEIRALTVVTGTVYVPVLLGKFSDTARNPFPRADVQQELFDGPWPTQTMTEYYAEISYGNLDVQGTVYDWVAVTQDDDYYAGSGCGLDHGTDHTDEFVTELLAANDPSVDFGQYDNDGPDGLPNSGDDDGYVDFVATVHPEVGGECGGGGSGGNPPPCISAHDIWPFRSALSNWPAGVFTTDDAAFGGGSIKVDDFTIMPARACPSASVSMIQIGVFCHEFGHVFGLPDLYDTSTGGSSCLADFSSGVGEWDLMASGSWGYDGLEPERPTHMSAWSKAFVGWLTPGVVAFDLPNWPVQSSTLTPTAFKLWTGGDPTTEYFLVEYRSAHGFDSNVFTPGILIWHVDEDGLDNANECHKLLDLECEDQSGTDHTLDADDLDSGPPSNRGDAGDPFCDGDTFSGTTNPSSDSYSGTNTSVQVTNINGCGGGNLRASFFVGADPQDVDLCIRDCGSDVCTTPSPCPNWWASPDIYIDGNLALEAVRDWIGGLKPALPKLN